MKLFNIIMLCSLIFTNNCYPLKTTEQKNIYNMINCAISPSCLLNNYYLVTRLKNSIALLRKIPKDIIKKLPFNLLAETENKIIDQTIAHIKKEKNLQSLFLCWHQITIYQVIINENFFTEFALLVCKLLCLITQITIDKTKTSTLETIISISQKIDRLPLSEILHTIDMLTDELPAFLEKYEFKSTMSWKNWIKKYWWMPPVITFWFGLKILIKFQHRPGYFTYSYYPQPIPTPIITNDPALLEIMRQQEATDR